MKKYYWVFPLVMVALIAWSSLRDIGKQIGEEKCGQVWTLGDALLVILSFVLFGAVFFLSGRDSKDDGIRRRIMSWSPSASPSAAPDDEENN